LNIVIIKENYHGFHKKHEAAQLF